MDHNNQLSAPLSIPDNGLFGQELAPWNADAVDNLQANTRGRPEAEMAG
jgi:hypothetical protein